MLKNQEIKDSLLLCEACYDSSNFPKDFTKEDFEVSNFFNIINPSESKPFINSEFNTNLREKIESEQWSFDETMKLIEALEKHGENWEEITKVMKCLIISYSTIDVQRLNAYFISCSCL
jgi:hypothetical protein